MTRIEFCNLLVDNRKKSGCKMKDICFALDVMPTAIYRLEKGNNSFSVVFAMKYLTAIKSQMVLKINKKEYSVESYSDLVKCLKKARGKQLSQRGLAACANISYTYFANVESEKMIVGVDNFLKLAEILSIDIAIKSSNQLTNEQQLYYNT